MEKSQQTPTKSSSTTVIGDSAVTTNGITKLSLYKGKYELEFKESSHRYKINGEQRQGVTTALGILAKPQLIQWAANMAVRHISDNSVANPANETYTVSTEVLQDARYAHNRRKEQSGSIGTNVHTWLEDHINGNTRDAHQTVALIFKDVELEGDIQEILNGVLESLHKYLRWEEEIAVTYLFTEKIVYSEKYGYCGTFDLGFQMNGKTWLGDFKTGDPDKEYNSYRKAFTGKLRARTEHMMQCAAYDQAYTEEHGALFEGYMTLYITKGGELHIFATEDTEAYKRAFLQVFETYSVQKEINKLNQYI